jgi:spore coat polysaccharide biosynthesis predicted glycosyltransferase SpsG
MSAVFRCDATSDIGFGHLSRCIALAEAFAVLDISSSFAGLFDPAAKKQIADLGHDRVDADPVNAKALDAELAETIRSDADFVIVDSYRATAAYVAALRELGAPTVVIDDFAALESYPCGVVLNFTWAAASLGYPHGPVLLLGPGYFPARRRLVELRPQSIERQRGARIENLLIVIGGADPKRIAARLIRILRGQHSSLCLRVIAANAADLDDGLAGFAGGSAVLPRQPDLSEHLLWADACISGGGLIKYEAAFMGVPAAAVSQNEGQAGESDSLAGAGLVFDLGLADSRTDRELASALDIFIADTGLRGSMAARARESFPPDPSGRAARAILDAVKR